MQSDNYTIEPHPKYGFFQVTPTPSPEAVAKYYADEFYSQAYPQLNNSSLAVQERDKAHNDAHREEIYKTLCQLQSPSSGKLSLLDYGCGWGHTLAYFKEKGYECYGCDPAPEAVAHGKSIGLNVKQNGMDTMRVFEDKQFDVVLMLNVLEHLADPIAVIDEIKKHLLKPNGILVIEVPNDYSVFQECAVKVHQVPKWWVAPPAHLNYFNKNTLRNLLHAHGFSVEKLLGSFPLELFLLFGDNYIGNPELGRQCHEKRVAFEKNMKAHGYDDYLQGLYEAFGELSLGRQILTYARSTT